MSEPSEHEPSLTSLEAAMRELKPASAALNRDQLFFCAGVASMQRRRWLWPAVSTALACVAASLAAIMLLRPEPSPQVRIVYIQGQQPSDTKPPLAALQPPEVPDERLATERSEQGLTAPGYLQLRSQVLRWGVDALPDAPPVRATEPQTDDDLRDLMPHPRKSSF